MATIIPQARPKLAGEQARLAALNAILLDTAIKNPAELLGSHPVHALAVRGYYPNSFKRPRVNDYGVYDDAIFLITSKMVYPFNGNVDPSKIGWNPGVDKYYAQLAPGVWPFRPGPHKGVEGRFRQMTSSEAHDHALPAYFADARRDGDFTVRRVHLDETSDRQTGYFAINIHPGRQSGTSSWGCQTMPEAQFTEFRDLTYAALLAAGQTWLPYVLTEQKFG
jgi:lysozyme